MRWERAQHKHGFCFLSAYEAACEGRDGSHRYVSAHWLSMTVKHKPPALNEDYTNELPFFLLFPCPVAWTSCGSQCCHCPTGSVIALMLYVELFVTKSGHIRWMEIIFINVMELKWRIPMILDSALQQCWLLLAIILDKVSLYLL